MAKFALVYRQRKDHASRPEEAGTWMAWFGSMGKALVDVGDQVGQTSSLGNTGADTRLAGYSVIAAADLDAALAIAKGCPTLAAGGGVEVGRLLELGATTRKSSRGGR